MLFNSFDFLVFFPLVTLLYFALPHSWRWAMLLLASCAFYMFFIPVYIFILIITILIDYFAGIMIENAQGPTRKLYLIVSIISTCLVLFVFKYFNFFNANFKSIADFFHLNYPIQMVQIILPIGLSFHTFQSLSYVIEVYRKNQKAEHHFGIYALYVMFYPQLVAGPIERPQNLLHQFYERHRFEYDRVVSGLRLMLWGLFKKVVIADRLAIAVNMVYNSPDKYNGLQLITATLFFAFQIYCDFSGYSDMAIGAARVMGFRLMRNFNMPYISTSISEFWKRWHISLSTWFRDYVYISLGGNRVKKFRWYFNLMATFTISGLWHGANWTFVIWGALNGFYLVFALWMEKIYVRIGQFVNAGKWNSLNRFFQMGLTFSLTCIAWVFFRARNVHQAVYIIRRFFEGWSQRTVVLLSDKFTWVDFCLSFALIFLLAGVSYLQRTNRLQSTLASLPQVGKYAFYVSLLAIIFYLGIFEDTQFIYFQF